MNKPNFFIVGAPKCGTTAMNDYLDQHPDIFMAPKEIHFFGQDLKIRVRVSKAEYLQNFQAAGDSKIIGEASVWYLFSTTAAEEIKQFTPEAKILIMLRNPLEVIQSLHSQSLFDGNEDVFDFEKALNLDEKRKRGEHLSDSLDFFEMPTYKDAVLFSKQVERYLKIFGKSNVHIILYDDFKVNPQKMFKETLHFLGLPDLINIEFKVVNPNKQIQIFYLHRLLKKPPQHLKKIVRIILPFREIRRKIMILLNKWNLRIAGRKKISSQINNKLKESLSGDIVLLGNLINKDLSGWLK